MLTLDYIAGFFDGEGYITSSSPRYPRLLIGIENTDLRILEDIAAELGGGVKRRSPRSNEKPVWRTRWEWHLCGRKAADVLKVLLPHLRVKREQAEIAMRFQDHMDFHRRKFGIKTEPSVVAERQAIALELSAAKRQAA